jgi:hypothetical protein
MPTPAAEKAVAATAEFGSAALALNYFEQVVERSGPLTTEDFAYKSALRRLVAAERDTQAANDAAPALGEAA